MGHSWNELKKKERNKHKLQKYFSLVKTEMIRIKLSDVCFFCFVSVCKGKPKIRQENKSHRRLQWQRRREVGGERSSLLDQQTFPLFHQATRTWPQSASLSKSCRTVSYLERSFWMELKKKKKIHFPSYTLYSTACVVWSTSKKLPKILAHAALPILRMKNHKLKLFILNSPKWI